MHNLDGMKDQLEKTRKDLDEMTKTMLSTEEDKDMWKKLFEDCNKKQGEEIERLRRDYKERVIGAVGVDNSRGKSDTCKECSSWAVADGSLDVSRNESDNGNATPDNNTSSDNPGPE